ncbi:hypothetical protein KCU71_g110, partial [Aureobasidium melanogenum]
MLLVTALISVSLLVVVVFISWLASVVARSSRVGSGLVTFCFLGTVFLDFCAVLRAALGAAAALRLTTPDESVEVRRNDDHHRELVPFW